MQEKDCTYLVQTERIYIIGSNNNLDMVWSKNETQCWENLWSCLHNAMLEFFVEREAAVFYTYLCPPVHASVCTFQSAIQNWRCRRPSKVGSPRWSPKNAHPSWLDRPFSEKKCQETPQSANRGKVDALTKNVAPYLTSELTLTMYTNQKPSPLLPSALLGASLSISACHRSGWQELAP